MRVLDQALWDLLLMSLVCFRPCSAAAPKPYTHFCCALVVYEWVEMRSPHCWCMNFHCCWRESDKVNTYTYVCCMRLGQTSKCECMEACKQHRNYSQIIFGLDTFLNSSFSRCKRGGWVRNGQTCISLHDCAGLLVGVTPLEIHQWV